METVFLLVVVTVVVVAVVKYRSVASKERNEVLARMRTEHEVRGEFSPTAELFREVGAPVGALAGFPANQSSPTMLIESPLPGHDTLLAPPPPPPPPTAEPRTVPTSPTPDESEPGAPAADLAVMFQGIRMPAGLAPLGEMTPTSVTFVSPTPARDVQPALAAELERIGAEAVWPEPTVAQVRRRGRVASLTMYPRPDLAVDLDGERLFPHAPPDSCVVRLALV